MFKVTALKLLCSAITYSLCQDFGKRLERDIKKFVNTRLDATKQLTGQEVQTANGGGNTKLMYCNVVRTNMEAAPRRPGWLRPC